jgi:hypothetical protein
MTCCDLEVDKNGNQLCPNCGRRVGMYRLDSTMISSGTAVPTGLAFPRIDHYHDCLRCSWTQDNIVINT